MTMPLEQLREFRTSVYNILGKAKDALFDLMDAALITRSIYAFVELALSPSLLISVRTIFYFCFFLHESSRIWNEVK
ncbi:hypothetical protein IQ231_08975 [Cuspidothrix issatschenkoi LEGE 03284]|uniref:hypothetical protein n=1 Tax=Cuspidothrix issatschenkoi TaxID=230752 RepID=UPI0019ECCEDB|nr:hypothetical protein [Cuspidothrix issatschenkoi]MBE9231816.1 hypothetical protein [Cuspidothrix issatschenkoi LEGE 03284]